MSKNQKFNGTVKWFNKDKGYGFIDYKSEGKDESIFVHYSEVVAEGFKTLVEKQKVEFEIGTNNKGTVAEKVVVLA